MNYITIIITVCILSHQNNLFSSDDDIDKKLSIEYTRAEKIVQHLTKELQILENTLTSKKNDYQPTLDEIKHEISVLETIITNRPNFHDDVAENIKSGRAYQKWFSLDYIRNKIKEETDKYYKDISKKVTKKICLQKQKNKEQTVSNTPKNIEIICEDKTLQENIIVPKIIESQTSEIQPLIDQTTLPKDNEQNQLQAPWYSPYQLYINLKNFIYNISHNIVNMITFI